MTPHDELMALAALHAEVGESLRMHDEVTGGHDYGYISPGLRAAYAAIDPQRIRALLDYDAFRAMVRDADRYRRLRENCRPWDGGSDEPHALIRICRGEFRGGVGWFNLIGPSRRVGIIDLDTAVDAAFGEAIDAAASGAGEPDA